MPYKTNCELNTNPALHSATYSEIEKYHLNERQSEYEPDRHSSRPSEFPNV